MVVTNFGCVMQLVSTSAPKKIAAQAITDNYRHLIAPSLLAAWIKDPTRAAGRQVSSPWPDHIAITDISQISTTTYAVTGNVIELTSDNVVHGGIADQEQYKLADDAPDRHRRGSDGRHGGRGRHRHRHDHIRGRRAGGRRIIFRLGRPAQGFAITRWDDYPEVVTKCCLRFTLVKKENNMSSSPSSKDLSSRLLGRQKPDLHISGIAGVRISSVISIDDKLGKRADL